MRNAQNGALLMKCIVIVSEAKQSRIPSVELDCFASLAVTANALNKKHPRPVGQGCSLGHANDAI